MSTTNIRKGIYETNSSSVHVLCINTDKNVKVPDTFVFYSNAEFGWEDDVHTGSYAAGKYLYKAIKYIGNQVGGQKWNKSDDHFNLEKKYGINGLPYNNLTKEQYTKFWDESKPIRQKYVNDTIDEYKSKVESILNQYGCIHVVWQPEDDNFFSYIDHGEDLREFVDDVIECPELLLNFLFGDSKIITGNDNCDYDDIPRCPGTYDYEFIK